MGVLDCDSQAVPVTARLQPVLDLDPRMRIAMIGLRGIPHSYGGGEEFVLHVAPRLAARGHDIVVYCRSGYYPDRARMWQGVRRGFYPPPAHKALGQVVHTSCDT